MDSNEIIISLDNKIHEKLVALRDKDFSEYKRIVIDFDNVKKINSSAIREWICLLVRLKGKEVVYRNCRKNVVDQMNIVHGLVHQGIKVESIYLPYFCKSCNKEVSKSFKMTEILEGRLEHLEVLCPQCSKPMEFYQIFNQYFKFYKLNDKS